MENSDSYADRGRRVRITHPPLASGAPGEVIEGVYRQRLKGLHEPVHEVGFHFPGAAAPDPDGLVTQRVPLGATLEFLDDSPQEADAPTYDPYTPELQEAAAHLLGYESAAERLAILSRQHPHRPVESAAAVVQQTIAAGAAADPSIWLDAGGVRHLLDSRSGLYLKAPCGKVSLPLPRQDVPARAICGGCFPQDRPQPPLLPTDEPPGNRDAVVIGQGRTDQPATADLPVSPKRRRKIPAAQPPLLRGSKMKRTVAQIEAAAQAGEVIALTGENSLADAIADEAITKADALNVLDGELEARILVLDDAERPGALAEVIALPDVQDAARAAGVVDKVALMRRAQRIRRELANPSDNGISGPVTMLPDKTVIRDAVVIGQGRTDQPATADLLVPGDPEPAREVPTVNATTVNTTPEAAAAIEPAAPTPVLATSIQDMAPGKVVPIFDGSLHIVRKVSGTKGMARMWCTLAEKADFTVPLSGVTCDECTKAAAADAPQEPAVPVGSTPEPAAVAPASTEAPKAHSTRPGRTARVATPAATPAPKAQPIPVRANAELFEAHEAVAVKVSSGAVWTHLLRGGDAACGKRTGLNTWQRLSEPTGIACTGCRKRIGLRPVTDAECKPHMDAWKAAWERSANPNTAPAQEAAPAPTPTQEAPEKAPESPKSGKRNKKAAAAA